jgi:hypothetical protein
MSFLSNSDYQVEYLDQYQRNCNVILTVVILTKEQHTVQVPKIITDVWHNASPNQLFEPYWLSSWMPQRISTQLQPTLSISDIKHGTTNSESFKGNHRCFTKYLAKWAFSSKVWKVTLWFRMFARTWCNAIKIDRRTNHFVWFTDPKVIKVLVIFLIGCWIVPFST